MKICPKYEEPDLPCAKIKTFDAIVDLFEALNATRPGVQVRALNTMHAATHKLIRTKMRDVAIQHLYPECSLGNRIRILKNGREHGVNFDCHATLPAFDSPSLRDLTRLNSTICTLFS